MFLDKPFRRVSFVTPPEYDFGMDAGTLNEIANDELDQALLQFAVAECAVHQSLLELIWAKSQRGNYQEDGATSMAAWLSLKLGWSARRANRTVRVAQALAGLPLIREAYAQGQLCWERVEALSKFATPENEGELPETALVLRATDLKRYLDSLEPVGVLDAKQAFEARSVRYFWDQTTRMLRIRALLPDVEGVAFTKAIEHLADKGTREPFEDSSGARALVEAPDQRTFEQACADALVELCSTYLDTSRDAVRATVVIHAELEDLREGRTGIASLDTGPMIAGETALRMACDCHSELVVEGPDRLPIGIGRRSRQIPGWLWRMLWHRDQGCRFPGCERDRWTQGHHIKHWTTDGPTDKQNLVLLCWYHHHLVHEGGWSMEGNPDSWLDFLSPRGETLTSLPPPPLDPELRDHLLGTFSGDPPDSEVA